MTIAVLGASGFLGARLVERLGRDGHAVKAFDRSFDPRRTAAWSPTTRCIPGDFTVQTDFSELLRDCDTVFHLISTTIPSSSSQNPMADVQGNLLPTLNLLEQMRRSATRRLVFPSSGGTVYGEPRYLPIDEAHPTSPIVPYGATKLAIEKYLQVYQHAFGLKTVCLRISNPFGPGFNPQSGQGAVGIFLQRALRGEPIEIWGDGKVQRDYIYIDDVINAFVAAMNYEGNEPVFNISTGVPTTLLDLISHITQIIGTAPDIRWKDSRGFDVNANVLCNQLARQSLGWQPGVTLSEGLRRTAEWVRAVMV